MDLLLYTMQYLNQKQTLKNARGLQALTISWVRLALDWPAPRYKFGLLSLSKKMHRYSHWFIFDYEKN